MTKAVIIGAGIGGSTLALMLKRFTKIQPLLYERAPSFGHIGAGLSLAPNALQSLDQLGLIPKLKAISQQVTSINLYSNQKRKLITNMDNSFYQDIYGYPLFTFERAHLQDLLVSELRENGIEVNFGYNCVRVSDHAESQAEVIFENGEEVEADLVVGADGGNSFLRSLTVPEGVTAGDGGIEYTGWATLYGITEPIMQTPTEGQAQIVSGMGCVYGCWPLPGKRQFWAITLNEPFPGLQPDKISVQKSLDACQDLWFPESYGGGGRFMQSIVERSSRSIKVPLMSGRWKTPNLGRIVLIGDAAHALPPFIGQGACQAIEDAASLASNLLMLPEPPIVAGHIGHVPRQDISYLLDRYTAIRKLRIEQVVKWGRSTGNVSMSESKIVNGLTELALKFVTTERIKKSVKWVYEPETLVKRPSHV